jgi:hypothetical protein
MGQECCDHGEGRWEGRKQSYQSLFHSSSLSALLVAAGFALPAGPPAARPDMLELRLPPMLPVRDEGSPKLPGADADAAATRFGWEPPAVRMPPPPPEPADVGDSGERVEPRGPGDDVPLLLPVLPGVAENQPPLLLPPPFAAAPDALRGAAESH